MFFMALCVTAVSCQKTGPQPIPVSYSVETDQNVALHDIYIPDSGIYNQKVLVKYLSGYHEDKVTISIHGLPAAIKVAEDTFSQVPTYEANFTFSTNHAALGTYPVAVTSSANGSEPKVQRFNIIVVPADCAANLLGNFSCTNACTGRNFSYVATGVATGATNTLDIKNLGGYGDNTLTHVILNCNKDSLSIPTQYIGNGTSLSGYGVFTANTMTIYYTATSTPYGFAESCNVTMVK